MAVKYKSRGIRNNNPGNIRWGDEWQGLVPVTERTDKAFCQFVSPEYGIRAMIVILRNYQNKHGLSTIRKIIHRWAPESENNTQAYINSAVKQTGIPEAMGRAARATVGDLVWAVLTGNPAMSDGKPLFHNDHKNLVNAPLTIEGLDKARQAMLLQKAGERRLNIRPTFMLTPVAMEARANQLIKSASVPGADANSGISNPIQNFVTVISEARLDDSNAGEYYLTAAQGRDTIEVAYLDGVDTPYLEQQQGFTVDGATFKVRIDAGVAPLDWRGLVKSTGKA